MTECVFNKLLYSNMLWIVDYLLSSNNPSKMVRQFPNMFFNCTNNKSFFSYQIIFISHFLILCFNYDHTILVSSLDPFPMTPVVQCEQVKNPFIISLHPNDVISTCHLFTRKIKRNNSTIMKKTLFDTKRIYNTYTRNQISRKKQNTWNFNVYTLKGWY